MLLCCRLHYSKLSNCGLPWTPEGDQFLQWKVGSGILQTDAMRPALSNISETCAGEITNIKSRTTDPEDSRLMKLVERKHRQEMKMARRFHTFPSDMPSCRCQAFHIRSGPQFETKVMLAMQRSKTIFSAKKQLRTRTCDTWSMMSSMCSSTFRNCSNCCGRLVLTFMTLSQALRGMQMAIQPSAEIVASHMEQRLISSTLTMMLAQHPLRHGLMSTTRPTKCALPFNPM